MHFVFFLYFTGSIHLSGRGSKHLPKREPKWHTVGVFKDLSHTVTSYIDSNCISDSFFDGIDVDNLPDFSKFPRTNLEPGTAYRFRLSAINSCGRGEWGEVCDALILFKIFETYTSFYCFIH